MARTVRWPPDLRAGRLAWTADPGEAVRQIVRLSLSAASSANPFSSDRSLEAFDALDAAGETRVRDRIRAVFVRLERERRARLLDLRISRDRGAGEVRAVIEYEDLETSRRERLEGRIDGA